MPFKAKNNREAVVVCAIHVVKRPSKRSVLVFTKTQWYMYKYILAATLSRSLHDVFRANNNRFEVVVCFNSALRASKCVFLYHHDDVIIR